MKLWRAIPIVSVGVMLASAQVADLSGTWNLNVQKSRWGKHPKPTSAIVTIEHHEPALKYSGTIVFPNNGGENGENSATFTFDGVIDGKEYPVTGSVGEGNISIRRTGPNATVSEFKSKDGALTETVRMTVDGKVLTRTVEAKRSQGEMSWTEVYDRR